MPAEESQAAMEGDTGESCVWGGPITIPSLPVRQHCPLNNREVGPTNA